VTSAFRISEQPAVRAIPETVGRACIGKVLGTNWRAERRQHKQNLFAHTDNLKILPVNTQIT
jgi:hypothetical protein